MNTAVVAPHYDDGDIGASVLAPGARLIVVAGRDEVRRREQENASAVLSMDVTIRGDFPDGSVTHDVALVHFIERNLEGVNTLLSPPVLDSHQDHQATALAVISATRRSPVTLIEYETASVTAEWVPNMWMPMTDHDLDVQTRAVSCHLSQAERTYMTRRWLEARAIFRGQQVGLPLAQAYRIVRHVGVVS